MSNQISGKIIKILPAQTGSGKNGQWIKVEFVIETQDQYPKKVCLSTWGDKASNMDSYQIGEAVKVSFNPESREYNDKWFTELRVWKMEREGGKAQAKEELPQDKTQRTLAEESDDLPF